MDEYKRLTARSPKNNMAYLVEVKPKEQELEGSYNTLMCVRDAFERLAAYEDNGLSPEQMSNAKVQMEQILEKNAALSEALRCVRGILRLIDDCGGEWEAGNACEGIAIIDEQIGPVKTNYSTYNGFCNKCGHETEHEKIESEDGDEITTITTCLVCGDNDVDVDHKMVWGEGEDNGEGSFDPENIKNQPCE